MNATAFDAYRYDGGVYAIPIGNKPTAGVYNTVCVRQDIMDAIGMDNIATLDDLTTYAEKAKEQYGYMRPTSWQMQLTSSEVPATAI